MNMKRIVIVAMNLEAIDVLIRNAECATVIPLVFVLIVAGQQNMMRTILEYNGMLIDESYIIACNKRRTSVEKALAIVLTATEGPNELFMEALDSYIFGQITLEELERRVDRFEYLGV